MRFSLNESIVIHEYMIEFLQTSHAKTHFLTKAKHAINQSSINQQNVKSLRVIIPPISRQRDFAARVEDIRSMKAQQSFATTKAKATFVALLAQAFT